MPDVTNPLDRPLLVVSPHLDDAMLSCSSVLLREGPAPVDVLTVLAGAPEDDRPSTWDLACGFATSSQAVAARQAEDERAFDGLAVGTTRLPLPDGAYGERPPNAVDVWVERCRTWVEDHGSCTVLLPAGAGRVDPVAGRAGPRSRAARRRGLRETSLGLAARRLKHRSMLTRRRRRAQHGLVANGDHAQIRDSLISALTGQHSAEVVLYEELPYLWSGPADATVRAVARRDGREAHLLRLPVDRDAKAERLAAYASQLPHLDPVQHRLAAASTLPVEERAWWLRHRERA